MASEHARAALSAVCSAFGACRSLEDRQQVLPKLAVDVILFNQFTIGYNIACDVTRFVIACIYCGCLGPANNKAADKASAWRLSF